MTAKKRKARDNYQIGKRGMSKKARTGRYELIRTGVPKTRKHHVIRGICDICHIREGSLRTDGLITCTLCETTRTFRPGV